MTGEGVLEYGRQAAELPPEVEKQPQEDIKAEQLRSRKEKLAVRFVALRTSNEAKCSGNAGLQLGVLNSVFQNAVEIEFTAKGFSKFHRFRIRRTVEEAVWFRRGEIWKIERQTPRWFPDNPTLPPECEQPPRLYDFDSPGIMAYPGFKGELNLTLEEGSSLKTDAQVDAVLLQNNFVTRVQERIQGNGFETEWALASRRINWHSIIQVQRKKGEWHRSGLNKIGKGHCQMKKPA